MNRPKPIKTIFMGTPEFAVPHLRALAADKNFAIQLVITKPDEKAGRGLTLTPPPIKQLAFSLGLPAVQPDKLIDIMPAMFEIKPDLIVVSAFSRLLPPAILDLPIYGCINVHASLLPKYRGAACVPAAILNGDQTSGLTIMKMEAQLDTGPILRQVSLPLAKDETTGSLTDKLSLLGAKILPETIIKYIDKEITPQEQNHTQATYARETKKSDAQIDWTKKAEEIERLVRAMQPWPLAWTTWQGQRLILTRTKILSTPLEISGKPGQIFLQDSFPAVICGQAALELSQIKLAGKNELSGDQFIRGKSAFIGSFLA